MGGRQCLPPPTAQKNVARWARRDEVKLIYALLKSGDTAGLIGKESKEKLRELIRMREVQLKKWRARLENQRTLDLWGGSSGDRQLDFRWSTARVIANDIVKGFHSGGETVIATLCSYEAERRMVRASAKYPTYTEERKKRKRLLEFRVSDGQCQGMSVFTLFYPCVTLAENVNPLQVSLSLINERNPVDLDNLMSVLEKHIENLLSPVFENYSTSSFMPDRRWYWAALGLMDKYYYGCSFQNPVFLWLESLCRDHWSDMVEPRDQDDADDGFSKHVELFCSCLQQGEKLGSPPRDLTEYSKKRSDLVPYWIYEGGGHKIVRHIPALPLSREINRLEELRRTLVAYRMVLGQPRQEDLLHCVESYLEGKFDADNLAKVRIDLSPPGDGEG